MTIPISGRMQLTDFVEPHILIRVHSSFLDKSCILKFVDDEDGYMVAMSKTEARYLGQCLIDASDGKL